jgi:hypothetical protein
MKRIIFPPSLLMAVAMFSSCENFWNHCLKGNGNRITETRTVTSFEEISANGNFDVRVDTGEQPGLIVRADENLMNHVVTRISGNRLIIESKHGDCLNPSIPIEIDVTVNKLNSMELNGSGNMSCFGLKTENLEILLTGSGQMDLQGLTSSSVRYTLEGSGYLNSNVIAGNLQAGIDGSGEIRIAGTAASSDLRITGSGFLRAKELNSLVCEAYISGSGNIETFVTQTLNVTITGSGTVYYGGNPVVTSDISGSGNVIRQ